VSRRRDINFKTIIRAAKLPMYKKAFSLFDGTRVAVADGYMAVWGVDTEERCLNAQDEVVDLPDMVTLGNTEQLIKQNSPPLEEMIKVNSGFFRRVISALDTKGQSPLYIKLHPTHICMAYEVDGDIHRAIVACMDNKDE